MADEATWTEANAPRLSRGQAMEFWFWCWSGAQERERDIPAGATAAPDAAATRLRFEASQCLRVQAAFERQHEDRTSYWRCTYDRIEEILTRGVTPLGAARFSRYLAQQARYWEGRARAGDLDREEATARLAVSEAASQVFHRILGASPAQVAAAAAALGLVLEPRGRAVGLWLGEYCIYDERTIGPVPEEEEHQRTQTAIRLLEEKGRGR